MNRREFIQRLAALGVAVQVAQIPGLVPHAWAAQKKGEIPYRQLGTTGEKVSIVGLGGFHLGRPSEPESIRIIRTAIDNGINFMDNSWDYNQGESEIRMGKALRDGYRRKVFLMTKIDGHTGKAATKQLNESLRRLQTDTIDLLQFHEIIRMSDPERIFAANGAFQAMLEAKKAGKIRYIGFTGHKSPAVHLKMLETCFAHNFTPATVQMPLNIMDAHYDSFQKQVLPVLLQRGIAPLGMKPMGARHLLESKTVTPMECLHYAMNLPVSVVITGCDSLPILEQALTAARTFRSLSDQEVSALLAKTGKAAEGGRYELYKTTDQFDSTAHNPQWLG
jgi:aryl-alcohol dehydrogenase-like predicted oxidoreductase